MQNVFEDLQTRILEEQRQSEQRIMSVLGSIIDHRPGVNLDKWIALKKVAEMYSVASKTLLAHKDQIVHTKMFGQIYFDKESLASYMEGGRPVVIMKQEMRTRRFVAA